MTSTQAAPTTLVQYVDHWANKKPNQPAHHAKRNGRWESVSWKEYKERVEQIAATFIKRGHKPGDCVVIAGANHPEWVELEIAAMAARGVPAPIYGTLTVAQTAYIAEHSEAKIICCDGPELLEKFLDAEDQGLLTGVTDYVLFFDADKSSEAAKRAGDRLSSFADLLAEDVSEFAAEAAERKAAIQSDEVAILIYTSGTTGVPKGVEIDHGGMLHIANGLIDFAPRFAADENTDDYTPYHTVSYLPLSHQAEQLLTNVLGLRVGGQSYFCPEIAQVRDYLGDVRPTVFLGVPRVWEKFEAALRGRLAEATGLRGKLADWAMATELACFREQLRRGKTAREYMPLKRKIARRLVIDKIKQALGLDRLEVAVTGSAPIAKETQDFFASLGICVYEVYGLTETSGAATITDPKKPVFGTVGKCFSGTEIRIGDEDEIQLRGRNMVKGYRKMPEETKALFTDDGWLKTGDAGSLDAEGNLKITGRLKEILITAGAKNVAPVELEFYLQSIVGVGQAMVVGDRKPFLCALLTLDPEGLEVLAKEAGTKAASLAEMSKDPKVLAYFDAQIEKKCNEKVARYQTIKKFHVLPHELTVESGEMTASMKLRRGPITEKYAEQIEAFYAGGTKNTPEG